MGDRPTTKFRPDIEPLEEKRPLSATGAAAPHGAEPPANAHQPISAQAIKPNFGYLVYRRTNPNPFNNNVRPPFGYVLVQSPQPVPGQTYNVLSLVMRNGTAKTFTAADGFTVNFSDQKQSTPILTGNETWAPGQEFIFYVLSKKYYPVGNQVTGGFVFDLGGAKSVAIPGPSGIFLRLKYDPARIDYQLSQIVQFGQGAQGGLGTKTGIANTQIYEFVSAKTRRNDFGGLF